MHTDIVRNSPRVWGKRNDNNSESRDDQEIPSPQNNPAQELSEIPVKQLSLTDVGGLRLETIEADKNKFKQAVNENDKAQLNALVLAQFLKLVSEKNYAIAITMLENKAITAEAALNALLIDTVKYRASKVIRELVSKGATNISSALVLMQSDLDRKAWDNGFQDTYQSLVGMLEELEDSKPNVQMSNAASAILNYLNPFIMDDSESSRKKIALANEEKENLTKALAYMIVKREEYAIVLLELNKIRELVNLEQLLLEAVTTGNSKVIPKLMSERKLPQNIPTVLITMQSFATRGGWDVSDGYQITYDFLVNTLKVNPQLIPLTLEEKSKLMAALKYMIIRYELAANRLLHQPQIRENLNINELLLYSLQVGNGDVAQILIMHGATNLSEALEYLNTLKTKWGWKTGSFDEVYKCVQDTITVAIFYVHHRAKARATEKFVFQDRNKIKDVLAYFKQFPFCKTPSLEINIKNLLSSTALRECIGDGFQAQLKEAKAAVRELFINAIRANDTSIVIEFLKAFPDYLGLDAEQESSPLVIAVSLGRSQIVLELLKENSQIQFGEYDLETAFEKAVEIKNKNTMLSNILAWSTPLADDAFKALQDAHEALQASAKSKITCVSSD